MCIQWSLFFPSVLQEFLRVWHHTQLFAFSGAIRATAHVPKQVRACTAPRACRNVLLSDWLAAVPSSFSWRLLSHYKRSCHDLLCTTTASLCTMSTAQAESKCSLSVSNDNSQKLSFSNTCYTHTATHKMQENVSALGPKTQRNQATEACRTNHHAR